jgi:hybrid cluster-associated redox disulfide protein
MTKITKDMIISEVLEIDRGTVPILFKHGLHCLGCAMASGESLEEACEVHGIDSDALLSDLNEYLELKGLPQANV